MYNNVYEDYIRSMIGKNVENSRNDYLNCGNTMYDNNMYGNSIYGNCEFGNDFLNSQMPMSNNGYFASTSSDVDLEECYPELYRLLYPMVQKVCMKCTRSLSRNVIDEMVEEVYSNFVGDEGEITQININLSNEVRSSKDNVGSSKDISKNNLTSSKNLPMDNVRSTTNKSNTVVTTSSTQPRLDRSTDRKSEDRQVGQRNSVLNDLIRILILRELLGRPGGNFRPPFGRPPQRPPHNRPNDNIPNFPNSPNFPNFPNRPNPGRPRENRLSLNQSQQSIYNSYPSEMFEDGYNIF